MKETVLDSKIRFYEFYIALFEKLNGNFLTGFSMRSFIQFFEDEQSIVQSLIDGCFFTGCKSGAHSAKADCVSNFFAVLWLQK